MLLGLHCTKLSYEHFGHVVPPPSATSICDRILRAVALEFSETEHIDLRYLLLSDTGIVVALPQGTTYESHDWVAPAVRELAVETRAHGIYSICETWHVQQPLNEPVPSVQPRHHPDRKEALLVSLEDALSQRPQRSWLAEIERLRDAATRLHEWKEASFTVTRAGKLLPPEAYRGRGPHEAATN